MGAVVALTASVGTASADRKLLILVDTTGSMSGPSTSVPTAATRFDAAIALAQSRISFYANSTDGVSGIAVYSFHDDGIEAFTGGAFVDTQSALNAVAAIPPPFGSTPLAGSMCQAIDILGAFPATTEKVLAVFSDGGENSTPDVVGGCFGPFSGTSGVPFETGSWQNKVYKRGQLNHVVFDNNFFFNVAFAPFARVSTPDPEAEALAMIGLTPPVQPALRAAAAGPGLTDGPLTDFDFFAALAHDSGGVFHAIVDNQPLPVFGDIDDDRCVDRTDALLIARAIGHPATLQLDLNGDGVIGFGDYAIAVANFGTGCGAADPYVPAAPILCQGAKKVVIDGKAIESAGLTIDARGACQIVIKNSLIVAGQNAIRVLGTALITIDNSILVGEQAVVSVQGAAVISAANTVFHGPKLVSGVLAIVDRGGNVWE